MKPTTLLLLFLSIASLIAHAQDNSIPPFEELSDDEISKIAEKMIEDEKKNKKARIRFFNGTQKSNLLIQQINPTAEKTEISLGFPISYTGYTTLDPGLIKLSLYEKTENPNTPPSPLLEIEHELKEKEHFTGIVLEKEGRFTILKLIDNFDFNSKSTYDVFVANFTTDMPVTIKNKNSTLGTLEFADYLDIKSLPEFPHLYALFPKLNIKEPIALTEGHDNLKSLMVYLHKDRYGYITYDVLSRGPDATPSREELIQIIKQEQAARRAATEQSPPQNQ
jgi:hypothetical protein